MRVGADGTWEDLPAGETGLLAISGPTVFPGYVTDRDANGHVLDGQCDAAWTACARVTPNAPGRSSDPRNVDPSPVASPWPNVPSPLTGREPSAPFDVIALSWDPDDVMSTWGAGSASP